MATVKVLLTGFGKFDRYKKNPSEILVKGFDVRKLEGLTGVKVRLKKLILPVHVNTDKVLAKMVGKERFDIIIHTGLHSYAKVLHVETRANNKMNFKRPDILGNIIKNEKISAIGPRYLRSNLPFKAIIKELRKKKIKTIISDNAGGYICNLLLYKSLNKNKKKSIVGFIHFPQFEKFSKKRSMDALVIVLEKSIQQAIKGRRARRQRA